MRKGWVVVWQEEEGRRVAGMAAKLSPWGPVSPRTSKLSPRREARWTRESPSESVTSRPPAFFTPPLPLPPNPIRLFSRASSHEQREISSFVRRRDAVFIKRSTSKILDPFTLVLIRGQPPPNICDSNMIGGKEMKYPPGLVKGKGASVLGIMGPC